MGGDTAIENSTECAPKPRDEPKVTVTNPYAKHKVHVRPSPPGVKQPVAHAAEANSRTLQSNNNDKRRYKQSEQSRQRRIDNFKATMQKKKENREAEKKRQEDAQREMKKKKLFAPFCLPTTKQNNTADTADEELNDITNHNVMMLRWKTISIQHPMMMMR